MQASGGDSEAISLSLSPAPSIHVPTARQCRNQLAIDDRCYIIDIHMSQVVLGQNKITSTSTSGAV